MNKAKSTSWMSNSLLLPGCMFGGMGIGMIFNATNIGLFIGMGAGFITNGIIKLLKSNESNRMNQIKTIKPIIMKYQTN